MILILRQKYSESYVTNCRNNHFVMQIAHLNDSMLVKQVWYIALSKSQILTGKILIRKIDACDYIEDLSKP